MISQNSQSTTLGSKDGFRKSEFVTKTQFLKIKKYKISRSTPKRKNYKMQNNAKLQGLMREKMTDIDFFYFLP